MLNEVPTDTLIWCREMYATKPRKAGTSQYMTIYSSLISFLRVIDREKPALYSR